MSDSSLLTSSWNVQHQHISREFKSIGQASTGGQQRATEEVQQHNESAQVQNGLSLFCFWFRREEKCSVTQMVYI